MERAQMPTSGHAASSQLHELCGNKDLSGRTRKGILACVRVAPQKGKPSKAA